MTPSGIAALGPFFAFETHAAGSAPETPWRSMGELVDGPAVLADRVDGVRRYLAAAGGQPAEAVELRVAASVTHLGLVARLVSPALAVAVLHGAALTVDLAELRWQPVPGSAFPLSLPQAALERMEAQRSPAALADRLGAELIDGPIRQLVCAAGALSVSPRILWGNVASAVNGAATALAAASPTRAESARSFAALLLSQPALRGTSLPTDTNTPFRRRSCCLIYRAARNRAGALCGDCVLTRG